MYGELYVPLTSRIFGIDLNKKLIIKVFKTLLSKEHFLRLARFSLKPLIDSRSLLCVFALAIVVDLVTPSLQLNRHLTDHVISSRQLLTGRTEFVLEVGQMSRSSHSQRITERYLLLFQSGLSLE